MQSRKSFSRVVVKVGSSLISPRASAIELKYLKALIEQIEKLWLDNKEVVLVSSGAVACGMSLLNLKERPRDMDSLQAAAAIGQNELMAIYRRLLKEKNRLCAQLLLTWDDFENRNRYLNVRATLRTLLKNKALPVINENDTVSTDEIRFGDNDRLSAMVANLIGADLLLILSDVDGLYRLPEKQVIERVDEITPEITNFCCKTDKPGCVGGMSSKLEAIKIACGAGVPAIIANGRAKDSLLKSVYGEKIGTFFAPHKPCLKAKKSWIAYGVRTRGRLIVDSGAKKALVEAGKSLLSVGIEEIEGDFKADDTVSIADKDRNEFARGKVNFSAKDLRRLKGRRLEEEVIHRDDLVIL
ncbi:MAG: glutamate 5-kinase [Candidatus Omnitrophota bacterium]|nr:glutamate 5-kinase [Candidatus Omnitrophota bacterium]